MDTKTREKKFRNIRIICVLVVMVVIVVTAYYMPEKLPVIKGIIVGVNALLAGVLMWHLAELGVVTGELIELHHQKERIDDTVARKIKRLESALYRAGHRLNSIDRGEGDEFLWQVGEEQREKPQN